jgi:hypothetical protein
MASLPINKTRTNVPIVALLAGAIALCTFAPATPAQDAIRVETDQVVVPVVVVDKDRLHRLWLNPENMTRALLAGDMKLLDALLEAQVIRGLTADDFHVFDDGKEQTIQNLSYERSLYWDIRDNEGHHTEYVGPGGGKWSTAEWPGLIGDLEPSHYLLAYNLPQSPEGSCHKITVKVDHDNAAVGARGEYCNTKHSASDPVNGTKLGTQLENDLGLPKNESVKISLLAIPLFANSDAVRVHIALDWPWESLKGESRTRGILGLIFSKDGTLVGRFSDLADREGVARGRWAEPPGYHSDQRIPPVVENRYETQLTLAPGKYDLRVVLGDGTRFGHAEIPLTVEGYERKELTISGVSLCKRISDVAANSARNTPNLPGAWGQKLRGDYKPLVSRDVEFKPTGNTRFKKGDTLYTYFEIREPLLEGQSSAAVQIQMRIFDSRNGELISDSQPISAAPYIKAGSSIIPVGRGMDISKLPIGSYRLDVQATDSTGKSTAWRSANFTVE